MPTIQGLHWSFTLNFEDALPDLKWSPNVQYAIWQHERVSHDHLQGYVQVCDRGTTLKKMKDLIPGAHFQKVIINSSGRKPWEYASKVESRVDGPWEYGIRIEKGSNKRSKIESCERSPDRMAVEDTDLFRMYMSHKKQKIFINEYVAPELNRPWQLKVTSLLDMIPDDRSVIWVFGEEGGEGKTTYAKSLVQKGFAYIDPNKYADMFEMYHQQGTEKNVVCDFHRSCDVDAFYGFIEKVKNRVIPKIKYRSSVHIELNQIHLVVMSNVPPNLEKISKDRVVLIHARKPKNITDIPILMPYKKPPSVGYTCSNGNSIVAVRDIEGGYMCKIQKKCSGGLVEVFIPDQSDIAELE